METPAQAGIFSRSHLRHRTPSAEWGSTCRSRTGVFTAHAEYDGKKTRLPSPVSSPPVAGRAGRAGYDTVGRVVVAGTRERHRKREVLRQGIAKNGGDAALAAPAGRQEEEATWRVRSPGAKPKFGAARAAGPRLSRSRAVTSRTPMVLNVIGPAGQRVLQYDEEPAHRHTTRTGKQPQKHIHRVTIELTAPLAGGSATCRRALWTRARRAGPVRKAHGDLQYDFTAQPAAYNLRPVPAHRICLDKRPNIRALTSFNVHRGGR